MMLTRRDINALLWLSLLNISVSHGMYWMAIVASLAVFYFFWHAPSDTSKITMTLKAPVDEEDT